MMIEVANQHIPVMLEEAIELLEIRPGGVYVDCTAGMGGHSRAILERLQGKGRLIALDRDAQSLEFARRNLADFDNFSLHQENFKNLPLVLTHLGIDFIDGCLVDLGVSKYQLTEPGRGFSFREEGPLDMRMDRGQQTTAEQLVAQLPEPDLADIFRRFGEEPQAKKIARAIVEYRQQQRIRTTTDLAQLVESIKKVRPGTRIHPATQVFQALRIAVNQELEGLEPFIDRVIGRLSPGGRLAVISFHSLEDRIVKKTFQLRAGRCICFRPGQLCRCPRKKEVEILTRKPLSPSAAEISQNPSSRSAKLRAVARVGVKSRRKPS